MAKTRKANINKAAEIRAYFAANPGAKGAEVVAAFAKRGIKVSMPQVYNAKASAKPKKKRRVARVGAVRAAMNKDEGVGMKSLNVIEAAFTMLEHMTADAAKAVIDRLSGGKRKAK